MDELYSCIGDNTAPTQKESLVLLSLLVASPLIVIGVVSLIASIVINWR